jgi:hypothetical protein
MSGHDPSRVTRMRGDGERLRKEVDREGQGSVWV